MLSNIPVLRLLPISAFVLESKLDIYQAGLLDCFSAWCVKRLRNLTKVVKQKPVVSTTSIVPKRYQTPSSALTTRKNCASELWLYKPDLNRQ